MGGLAGSGGGGEFKPGSGFAVRVPDVRDKNLRGEGPRIAPQFVLYLSCGEEKGTGRVYQVDQSGRILGMVNLPHTATGIALHGQSGLIVAEPRDGGLLQRIDEVGKVTTICQRNPNLLHPVDVGVAGASDTVVAADNFNGLLAATTAAGGVVDVYRRLAEKSGDLPRFSVAVTRDRHVILGSERPQGIFRFFGSDPVRGPVLPGLGGVAADPISQKWAAAQSPNAIYLFDGEQQMKRFGLPVDKQHYLGGLLSFAPGNGLVAAARPARSPAGPVSFVHYDTQRSLLGDLFVWDKDRLVDFVVGPRMTWDLRNPSTYKSTY